ADAAPDLEVLGTDEDGHAGAARAAAAHAFDLATENPHRATLFAHGDQDHDLLLTKHHRATDGWTKAPQYNPHQTPHNKKPHPPRHPPHPPHPPHHDPPDPHHHTPPPPHPKKQNRPPTTKQKTHTKKPQPTPQTPTPPPPPNQPHNPPQQPT
ncbi:hypothetical protein, partial [Streptomyces sp. BE303]|uniref:hypothetical protein n=1 Tax=Streptomyces sp. BE303 TaxID=3002528 RepID=UPI002E76A9F3